MKRVKVIGATGYGGIGVLELLLRHPEVEVCALAATENTGHPISAMYPHMKGFCDLPVVTTEEALQQASDVTFFSTPDRVGMQYAAREVEQGAKVIDYSGDFRFNAPTAYAEYASRIGLATDHVAGELLDESVYGLPELHRARLDAPARIVGNPGCFAVSCILGLAPAMAAGLVDPGSIICDGKTGVSGAGKKVNPAFHFPARHENMNAYRLSGHQHVCEIERELGLLAGEPDLRITFTSQVVPLCRGIMSTLYADLLAPLTEAELVDCYRAFYADAPFVRVFGADAPVGTMHVRGSNFCNLVISVDARTGRLRVVSYIDNLMKGQAGSAVQNMNCLLGFPETLGLDAPGMFP